MMLPTLPSHTHTPFLTRALSAQLRAGFQLSHQQIAATVTPMQSWCSASAPVLGRGRCHGERLRPPGSCQLSFQAGQSPSLFAQPASCAWAKGTDEAIATPALLPPGSAGPCHRFVTAPSEGNGFSGSKAPKALKTPRELVLEDSVSHPAPSFLPALLVPPMVVATQKATE